MDAHRARETLREAAGWYYEAAMLHEDEDLDPSDHLKVVLRAFTSSDCDDLAAVLAMMTGWAPVRASWTTPGGFGHHALVRSPDGRLLDVGGWTDAAALARRHRVGSVSVADADPIPQNLGRDVWDGIDETAVRVAAVVRALPHPPYCEGWFREMSGRPLEGAEIPLAGRTP